MADDWEQEDWEKEDYKPVLPAAKKTPEYETKGEAILATITGPDMSKFADEDQEEDNPDDKHVVPKPQPKKKEEKKYKETGPVDVPLDDPVAEKLRQQRLVEQSDFDAARELFDGGHSRGLDSILPKTLKEFEDLAAELVNRYVVPHRESKHFKAMVKALVKSACEPLTSDETKDVETCVAGLRTDKVKAEKAKLAEKKGVKKNLNLGKGGLSAGLDDYQYDYAGDADDDFM